MRCMCILNNIGKLTTNTLDTVNSNKTYVYYKMADTTTSESLRMFKLGCCLKVRTHQVRVLPKLVINYNDVIMSMSTFT